MMSVDLSLQRSNHVTSLPSLSSLIQSRYLPEPSCDRSWQYLNERRRTQDLQEFITSPQQDKNGQIFDIPRQTSGSIEDLHTGREGTTSISATLGTMLHRDGFLPGEDYSNSEQGRNLSRTDTVPLDLCVSDTRNNNSSISEQAAAEHWLSCMANDRLLWTQPLCDSQDLGIAGMYNAVYPHCDLSEETPMALLSATDRNSNLPICTSNDWYQSPAEPTYLTFPPMEHNLLLMQNQSEHMCDPYGELISQSDAMHQHQSTSLTACPDEAISCHAHTCESSHDKLGYNGPSAYAQHRKTSYEFSASHVIDPGVLHQKVST